jgi:uncharacterized protein YutE (UPF0331/DUF86 family)
MADDVSINKAATLERCVARVREEYSGNEANLFSDQTRQDAIILNLQRACEAAIDLAMHRVRLHRLGVPQESRDAFSMLAEAGRLDPVLAGRMDKMVGFRNVAVHDYLSLNLGIVKSIVTERLDGFLALARWALTGD